MQLRLHDTRTREKRGFVPIDAERVRLYVCGPTVYDRAHIGNARPLIVFDLLFRVLRHVYGAERVVYVRNITDVDDKINARAAERGISIRALTEDTYAGFREDADALGCLPPTVEPRATEHIAAMRTLIERLVARGNAYVAQDHVLFDVPSMPAYGRLANRSLDEMLAGARVDVAPYKRSPMDFVLWKPSKPGEPSWPAPAGIAAAGRPGWHIECSAMSWTHLGELFDIHGGGIDLVFPHHENELAQTSCAFGHEAMANYWMHNGFLQVEGQKMAKSAGNFVTIREVLADWRGGSMRLAMMGTHYRQPIDWTIKALRDADDELAEWATRILAYGTDRRWLPRFDEELQPSRYLINALYDDLNTPEMIAGIRQFFTNAKSPDDYDQLYRDISFLGLFSKETIGSYHKSVLVRGEINNGLPIKDFALRFKVAVANNFISHLEYIAAEAEKIGLYMKASNDGFVTIDSISTTPSEPTVEQLVAARTAARKAKNFAEADRIRDELLVRGIVLKDGPAGTAWEVAP